MAVPQPSPLIVGPYQPDIRLVDRQVLVIVPGTATSVSFPYTVGTWFRVLSVRTVVNTSAVVGNRNARVTLIDDQGVSTASTACPGLITASQAVVCFWGIDQQSYSIDGVEQGQSLPNYALRAKSQPGLTNQIFVTIVTPQAGDTFSANTPRGVIETYFERGASDQESNPIPEPLIF